MSRSLVTITGDKFLFFCHNIQFGLYVILKCFKSFWLATSLLNTGIRRAKGEFAVRYL